MASKSYKQTDISRWLFIIGTALAVIAGIAIDYLSTTIDPGIILSIITVLGLALGFLNSSSENASELLLAIIALLVVGIGVISAVSVIGTDAIIYLTTIIGNFMAFVGAAGLVVSIKLIVQTYW